MDLGYDKPLYILPFDHRASFEKGLFGFSGALNAEQSAQVEASKRVVYDGFKAAIANGAPHAAGGILVDEQFGAAILGDAKAEGFITCAPVEKSGQDEFQFEYGDQWRAHIEAMSPDFIKVLVRYNPGGDTASNRAQAERLSQLSDYSRASTAYRFMVELLVPMTREQGAQSGSDRGWYDRELRPALMAQAILELQDAGVEPDVWKMEGLSTAADCNAIVAAARRDGREKVGCIVLGRGADEPGIAAWLKTAAPFPGFIGFAVGRTTFWDALTALQAGKIERRTAVEQIAARYTEWVRIFEAAQSGGEAVGG